MKKSIVVVVAIAGVVALAITASPVAIAGPANTQKVTDFETQALDADGCFKQVHCSQAHMVDRGDVVKENYHCRFLADHELFGVPALPARAVKWDYESSKDISGIGCDIELAGPFRWFSDIEYILTGDGCFMYTNPLNADIGDSDWFMRVTPSGVVNITVLYDPPTFELGNGDPCE